METERTKKEPQPSSPEASKQVPQPLEIVTKYRTEVVIPANESLKRSPPLKENIDTEDMARVVTEKELSARTKNRKMMVFDPETGCYRKKSETEDMENTVTETKTERVEYRFRLRSDERGGTDTETKDSFSKPDKASEDIKVSMDPVSTEQTIVINGKKRSRSEEGDGEDLKKAGDVMKAKFEEGRKKFEQEPLERKGGDSSKQSTSKRMSDDALEEKIREMEKRRERLLLRGPSMELEKRRASEEKKDVSPRDGPESPRSPGDDTAKRQRSRSERNKRRLTAEELSLKKTSGSEEDLTERSQSSSNTAKVR